MAALVARSRLFQSITTPNQSSTSYIPSVISRSFQNEELPVWNSFPDGSRFWNHIDCRLQRPIFVAATRQHVGKTTVSLALLSGLQKRFAKVGFVKPVGQQHVPVQSQTLQKEIRVDKDVCLMREHFGLNHIDYEHMR